MALTNCPECGKEISDQALMCPHCGFTKARVFGYEYRTRSEFLGLPLVHIASGVNPATGRPRVAKGIIAIGNIALGGIAFGGVSLGVISFGGLSAGLLALGGAAFGMVLALGGLAVGTVAVGGAAFGYYAMGGGAWGAHSLGGNARDPEAVEFFRRIIGDAVDKM